MWTRTGIGSLQKVQGHTGPESTDRATQGQSRRTGPHRARVDGQGHTGPESTAWLLPLTGTVGGDVSANNRVSNVIAWPCEMKCFSLKIWHLVATILMIFMRINRPRILCSLNGKNRHHALFLFKVSFFSILPLQCINCNAWAVL